MSLAERRLAEPTVSLTDLLQRTTAIDGETDVTTPQYAEEITASGFPDIHGLSRRGREHRLEGYVHGTVQREFPEQGLVVKKPETLRRWMVAYAAATLATAAYTRILDAATPGETDKPARSPKHQLADPALAAHLMGVDANALLRGRDEPGDDLRQGALFGALFEDLVARSVQVCAAVTGACVGHLRTDRGDHEVDIVVERRDGRVPAMEVKLNPAPPDRQLRRLRWLKARLGDDVIGLVLVTTVRFAYRQPDGIAVVPAALLGP